jgi:two-component sensor histidine kinase/DNA-binding NarL/FixJ family response regulator
MINEKSFQKQTDAQRAMMTILDDERKRISLDLHDLVQNKLRLLRDKFSENNAIRSDIQDILDEVRHIAYQLIPKNLQELSLRDYLNIYETALNQTYWKQFKTDYRTNVVLEIPKDIEVQLFSIVHECVNNVLKHAANTPTLLIRYSEDEENLMLLVQDFGDGFDIKKTENQDSIGLKGIKTRCEMMGATLDIKSNPLEGTRVKVTIPIEKIKNYRSEHPEITMPLVEQERVVVPQNVDLKKILIVDNQIEYGESLQRILANEYTAEIVFKESVKAAKGYLETHNYDIDVLITDITMPDESGIQLIKYLKDTGKDKSMKIILHTINDNPSYVFQATNVLDIKFYIWKEQAKGEKHPILSALENLDVGFYSPEIDAIKDSFKLKDYDQKEDSNHRKFFSSYVKHLKNGKSKSEATEETLKLHREEIAFDITTLNKYIRRYKNHLGISDELEMQHLVIKLSSDFGLLK